MPREDAITIATMLSYFRGGGNVYQLTPSKIDQLDEAVHKLCDIHGIEFHGFRKADGQPKKRPGRPRDT